MQRAEAAQEVAPRAQQHQQLVGARLRAFEEHEVAVARRRGARGGTGILSGRILLRVQAMDAA